MRDLNSQKNEVKMKADEKKVSCRLIQAGFLLFVSWFWVFLAWFWAPSYVEDVNLWFSRSGALLTAASTIASLITLSKKSELVGMPLVDVHNNTLYKKYETEFLVVLFVSNSSLFLATLIWGYGDMMRSAF